MTQTRWFDTKRDAVEAVTFMEDKGWDVKQLTVFNTPDGMPRFVVVFEREEGR